MTIGRRSQFLLLFFPSPPSPPPFSLLLSPPSFPPLSPPYCPTPSSSLSDLLRFLLVSARSEISELEKEMADNHPFQVEKKGGGGGGGGGRRSLRDKVKGLSEEQRLLLTYSVAGGLSGTYPSTSLSSSSSSSPPPSPPPFIPSPTFYICVGDVKGKESFLSFSFSFSFSSLHPLFFPRVASISPSSAPISFFTSTSFLPLFSPSFSSSFLFHCDYGLSYRFGGGCLDSSRRHRARSTAVRGPSSSHLLLLLSSSRLPLLLLLLLRLLSFHDVLVFLDGVVSFR